MRKLLLTVITAAAACLALTGSVALASAQANPHPVTASSHGHVTVHGHRTACNTLVGGDVNGSHTRFHVSAITNTCNDQYRALALCLGRTGSGTREYGPWVSGYSTSNTSPCPVNTQVIQGATQFPYHDRRTYCLYGCSSQLLAFTSHPMHESRGPWRSTADCSYSGKFNTDGSSFYSAALHTASCWDDFRGLAKCYIGRSGNKVRAEGPWQTVEPSARWSRANCPNGDTLYKGGFQGSAIGTGALTTVWRYTAPGPIHTTALQRTVPRTDCVLNYQFKVNDQLNPVWAQTRSRSVTTCKGQQRTVILVCLRGICNDSGFFTGGWVLLSNHRTDSRATSKIQRGSLGGAWFEDRGGPGQDVQCQRYFPHANGKPFDCDPADQP